MLMPLLKVVPSLVIRLTGVISITLLFSWRISKAWPVFLMVVEPPTVFRVRLDSDCGVSTIFREFVEVDVVISTSVVRTVLEEHSVVVNKVRSIVMSWTFLIIFFCLKFCLVL